jgi:hypothetical protein
LGLAFSSSPLQGAGTLPAPQRLWRCVKARCPMA